jgi:phosphoenolpyruvate-protein kinase (PTS system EI component)
MVTPAQREVFHGQPGPVTAVAVGQAWRTDPPAEGLGEECAPLSGADAADRLAEAFKIVEHDLRSLATEFAMRGQPESAQIAEASYLIASDPDLRAAAETELARGATPHDAVAVAASQFAALLEALPDPVLAGRAADVRAVGRRLAAALAGAGRGAPPPGPVVLIGYEVSADDLLVHADAVAGAATVVGGATSHAATIARSIGVPMIFSVDPMVLEVADETEALIDGGGGFLVARPGPAERDDALRAGAAARARRARLAADRDLPLVAADGTTITVHANVASAIDADLALGMGAGGVGLLRTEMPFLAAEQWPSLADHVAELTPVLRRLVGLPVIVRTLDFADDKLPPFLRRGRTGPLGRSLPLMLAEPDAFSEQLRAILATSGGIDLWIMVPMVASAAEMRQCVALVGDAAAALGVPAPPVGAMIELPEAVAAISEIAADAAFLSLGTNDLTASMLGLDRLDPTLTADRVTDPEVLGAIEATVRAGARQGIPVWVCGDAASDPAMVPVLLDAGCRIFSVAPSMLDEVREAIRSLSTPAAG